MTTTAPRLVILVVDDDEAVLRVLRRTLRAPDREILSAADGGKALALLASHMIDAVISDFNMPGMNGIELLSQVARERPNVARILHTANTDLAASAFTDGIVHRYLFKPCAPGLLRRTLDDAITSLREAVPDRIDDA